MVSAFPLHRYTIPSVAAVVIVSHREQLVDVWSRAESGWSHSTARTGECATITPLGVEIDVAALYAAAAEPPH